MPNSLRAKISKLRHKGEITQEEYSELINKLNGHDSELLDKVADMVLSLPKKYIDNFDYVACALILNGLEKMKAEVSE